MEREIAFKLEDLPSVRLALKNPDFTTARRIAQAINGFMDGDIAMAESSASVVMKRPEDTTAWSI